MTARPIYGRADELAALDAHWRAIRAERRPRIVTILAESGLGKTRLAQAFFSQLAARHPGYWPGALGVDGNNLRVNPDAMPESSDDMPFLWWGLRLVDPLSPNSIGAGVLHLEYERHLTVHLAPFAMKRRRKARRGEAITVGRGLLVDLAVDVIPFGGLIKTIGEAGADLHRIYREDRADTATQPDAGSLIARVLNDLAMMLGGEQAVPGVVVIDDAQFSTHDPGMVAFLSALTRRAAAEEWPLMILLTHWEKEWAGAGDGTIAALLRRGDDIAHHLLRLGPVVDLAPMLDAALPGLSAPQALALLERAGGNPRFLNEMILFATATRALFEGRDPARPLTTRGFERLLQESTSLHALIATRLRASPDEVQEAVTLASLQGVEFLQAVLGQTAIGLQADPAVLAAAVGDAETLHAYIARLAPDMSAFSQRIYYEVARAHLENMFDPDEARAALQDAVRQLARSLDFGELPRAAAEHLLTLAVGLFEEADDPGDAFIAAWALSRMLDDALNRRDAADGLAERLWRVIEASGDTALDQDLEWLRMIYRASDAGGIGAQVVDKLLRLTAETLAEVMGDDDALPEDGWAHRMHIRSLTFAAHHALALDDTDAAVKHAHAAADLRLNCAGAFEWTPEWSEDAIELLRAQAGILMRLGRPDQAREATTEQLAVIDNLENAVPDHPRLAFLRGHAALELAEAAGQMGDATEAAAQFAIAIARFRQVVEQGELSSAFNLVAAQVNRHAVLLNAGRVDDARIQGNEALEWLRDAVATFGEPEMARMLAITLRRLAEGHDDPATAIALIDEGIVALKSIPPGWQDALEEARLYLAKAELTGDVVAAHRALHLLGPSPAASILRLRTQLALADACHKAGHYADAATVIGAARICADALGAESGDPRFLARLRAAEARQAGLH